MLKLYNTQSQITSELSNFFKNTCTDISKPHIKNATDIFNIKLRIFFMYFKPFIK